MDYENINIVDYDEVGLAGSWYLDLENLDRRQLAHIVWDWFSS
jgi:hypothetical protein